MMDYLVSKCSFRRFECENVSLGITTLPVWALDKMRKSLECEG